MSTTNTNTMSNQLNNIIALVIISTHGAPFDD